MKVSDLNYFLPDELIAVRALKDRGSSRLLVLNTDGSIEHKMFTDLPTYLSSGDMLLINNTKVIPARLTGYKKNGGKVEILLVGRKGQHVWEILSRGRFTGNLTFSDSLQAEIHEGKTAYFKYSGDFMEIIRDLGRMPLPPYIRRLPDDLDKVSYQSIFAKKEGSIAAPTASLHFTDRLLGKIASEGVIIRELTLHVGIGTFKPVKTENVEEHRMETEFFEIDRGLISEIQAIKSGGKRVISVGTTATRAIEGYMSGRCNVISQNGKLKGSTDVFIYPGYTFKVIDSLITNFHLPGSTPLMLTSALCGRENLLRAYREAITIGYRFLSYGDAMLIL